MSQQAMSRYRIYCTRGEAEQLPPEVVVEEQYPAFVIALASEEVIEAVRKRCPVEKLKSPTPPPAVPDVANLAAMLPRTRTRGPYTVVVRFRAPVRQEWIEELKATGCESVGVLGSSTFVVRCPSKTSLAKLQSLPAVARISDYVPDIQVDPQFLGGLGVQADEEAVAQAAAKVASGEIQPRSSSNLSVPGTLVASFFTEEDMQSAKRSLRRQGIGEIREAGESRLVISLISSDDPAQAIRAIAERPGLRSLEEKKIKRMYNDMARLVVADRVVTSSAPDSLGLTGQGEILAVADTGLDAGNTLTLHADLRGRARNIRSFPLTPSLSPLLKNPEGDDGPADIYSGHGTHVCGSVLGNGARSIELGLNPIQGVAPEAELVFQAVEQTTDWNLQGVFYWLLQLGQPAPRSGLFGIPDSLIDLFQPAYEQGARIHSNSWGGGKPGAYDPECKDLDRFVWDHKDFLVLVAAGNDGADTNPPGDGIDAGSVTSPGTAKNCLTVGACENNRPGQFSDTYGQWWSSDFPKDPFKGDPMVDSIDDVVAFSSRGPCTTGRRKPDVIAPGTFVLSIRSSQIPSNNFGWRSFPGAKRDYMYMGGTSMATPLVAGCAALARQYLRQTVGISNPSAALLKATLIHSARYLRYRYACPDSCVWADNEQGWGRVDLQQVLNLHPPTAILFFDETQGLRTGDLHQVSLELIDPTVPFRVTMVYSDFPGEDLINNLNLLAIDPDGKFFVGNDFQGSGTPDSANNVEGILVENPKPGIWSIRVIASNVPMGPQDFALVVSGGEVRPA
jgi:serine protease AprX